MRHIYVVARRHVLGAFVEYALPRVLLRPEDTIDDAQSSRRRRGRWRHGSYALGFTGSLCRRGDIMSTGTVAEAVSSRRSRFLLDERPDDPRGPSTLWREFALCVGSDPGLWFSNDSYDAHKAVQICSECPVRLDCLGWAIEHDESYGIWGGVPARRRERKRRIPLARARNSGPWDWPSS
jgi:hypothetical protein